MEREILLTGIGGQGVQLAARVLALAAIHEGREVMCLGTYGGTMRGGDTGATVIIAEQPISSPPIVSQAWAALGVSPRYWPPVQAKLRKQGLAVVNGDLFETPVAGALAVPANRLAVEAGSPLAVSLALLGAFAAASGAVGLEALIQGMEQSLPPYRRQHLPQNKTALQLGFAWPGENPAATSAVAAAAAGGSA